MKKVSVVVPCYNVTEYLDRCMEHLLKQTIGIENIEIILVDDASTDGGATLNMIMEYEKRYPDTIIVIPLQQNMRQGGARNAGIAYASGEYLMFCDADDWLVLDAMETLYGLAKEHDADVVEFQYKKVESVTETVTIPEDEIERVVWDLTDDEKKKKYIMSSSDDCSLGCVPKFYRLSIIHDNNIQFAEHLICEEPSFVLPVRLYEKKHVLTNQIYYAYYQSHDSTMRSKWDDRKFDNVKVWMTLIQDLEQKNLLQKYHKELECIFYEWGFGLSIRMLIERDYVLTVQELNMFKKITLQLFPDVMQNSYVIKKTDGWNMLLQALLEMEITEENTHEFNRLLRYYIFKYNELLYNEQN